MNSHQRRRKVKKLRKKAKHKGSADMCFYCGRGMAKTGDDPATVEHLLAKSLGGRDDLTNLRMAHRRCNAAVANLPVEIKLQLSGAMERGVLPEWAKTHLPTPGWLNRLIAAADRDPEWAKVMACNTSDARLIEGFEPEAA